MTLWLTLLSLGCKVLAILLWHRSHTEAVLAFIAPDLILFEGLFVPGSQLLARTITRFRPSAPGRRELWLTIDDGPDPADTPRLLAELERHGARATFFLIGERAARHPELVAAILQAGHEIANHTHTHPSASFWIASPWRTRREIGRANEALRAAGAAPRAFRPAVGIKNLFLRSALRQHGLTCIGWTVRSHDCLTRDPADVARRVAARTEPGAIVLVHEGPSAPQAVRVEAIRLILEQATASGYRCVVPDSAQWR